MKPEIYAIVTAVNELTRQMAVDEERIEKLETALRAIIDRAEFRMGHNVTDAVCALARKALEEKDE